MSKSIINGHVQVRQLFNYIYIIYICIYIYIAMEIGPFIDGLPLKNGDFPSLC